MRKEIYSNWPYIFWLLFYFTLFWFILGANDRSFIIVSVIYGVSIIFALSPLAEGLWRSIAGVRPPSTKAERERLLPLFKEVYRNAMNTDPKLSKDIRLFIQNDMDVNAFAFGRGTLVLTRGSIELLNDECLKGLIAHEFGHFSHFDTVVILFAYIGNLFLSLVMKIIYGIAKVLLFMVRKKDAIFTIIFKLIYRILMGTYKVILFIGDMILMAVSREHEYMADAFASRCGYKENLIEVLYQIHQVSFSNPESVIEQLRSTHPPLTKRIERLEELKYQLEPQEGRKEEKHRLAGEDLEKGLSSSKGFMKSLSNMLFEYEPPVFAVNEVFSLEQSGETFRVLEKIIFEGETYLYIVMLGENSRPTNYHVIVKKEVYGDSVSLRKVTDELLHMCLVEKMINRKRG